MINRSSVPFSGYQARSTRVKKRGAISSAWLDKYKPELPEDSQHSVLHSDNLVENESETENVLTKECKSSEKGLNKEKKSLLTTGQSESSCLSVEETENKEKPSQNASSAEERNKTKKSPEVKLMPDSQKSTKEKTFKSKNEVSLKSKQREERKHFDSESSNDDLQLKATNSCQASKKSSTTVSDSFVVFNQVVSNNFEEGRELDPGDSTQETASSKRKAKERTTELEKPCKKFRTESDNEELIGDEGKV